MVNRYVAYTQRVNPSPSSLSSSISSSTTNDPSHSLILTKVHLWAGLRHKIRHAQLFVPVIAECEILKDEGSVVTRVITFKEGGRRAREVCRELGGIMVHYHLDDGSIVQNIIASGPDGTDGDLHLTYVFELFRPHVKEGSEQDRQLVAEYENTAKKAVASTISVIREMVVAGTLPL